MDRLHALGYLEAHRNIDARPIAPYRYRRITDAAACFHQRFVRGFVAAGGFPSDSPGRHVSDRPRTTGPPDPAECLIRHDAGAYGSERLDDALTDDLEARGRWNQDTARGDVAAPPAGEFVPLIESGRQDARSLARPGG